MATTAILDRLFHKAHIFNIDGKSYRLKDFDLVVAKGRGKLDHLGSKPRKTKRRF